MTDRRTFRRRAQRPCLAPATTRRRADAYGWAAIKPVCLAAALAAGGPAWALPGGAQVTAGQVQVGTPQAGQLVIRQDTAKAGIDWQRFSIGAGEKVQVQQPNANAVLLNRVVGGDPSVILGQLQANGRVFLSNPRGILFGVGSQVDVGGLVATTLDIDPQALANGRYQLTRGLGQPGELRAEGDIRASGTVALVSPTLVQAGSISAARVGLAAAGSVQVDVEGDGLIFFNMRHEDLATRLSVLGNVLADGGSVEARAVARSGFADTVLNMDGIMRARSIGERGGRIVIDGGPAGITQVAGTIDASGLQPGEHGGQATVLGEKVLLTATARLDARGDAGGGTVLAGGNWQGQGPQANAQMAYVAPGAVLDASATGHGHGGTVVTWSDDRTRFYGSARADGGAQGGDGGRVEVSGKRTLDFAGHFSAVAPKGRAGLLLLDPEDINIVTTGTSNVADTDASADALFAVTNPALAPTPTLGWNTIATALNSGNVVVTTANGGAITVVNGVTLSNPNLLTLNAAGALVVNAGADIVRTGAGAGLTLSAGTSLTLNAALTTTNAPITLNSGAGQTVGALSAGSGAVTINSAGAASAGVISAASLTKTGAGTLTLGNGNAVGSLVVSAGGVVLQGGSALPDTAAVLLADVAGASLSLGNDETIGSLAGGGATGGNVALGTSRLTTGGNGTSTTFGGVISGSAAAGTPQLVKEGGGTFALTNTNTYTGDTVVGGGTLALSGGNALNDAGAVQLADVAGVVLSLGANETIGSLSGGGANGGNVALGSFQLTTGGNNASTGFGGVIGGTPGTVTTQLVKQGSGIFTLSNVNSYSGGTLINAGTLSLLGGNALADAGAVQIADAAGARLSLGANETIGSLSGGGAIGGEAALGAFQLATGGNGASSTFNGLVSGSGAAGSAQLVKQGGGNFTLGSAGGNGYTGGTRIEDGVLSINNDNQLGAVPGAPTAGALTLAGGTLRVTGATTLATNRGLLIGAGGGTIDTAAALQYGGTAVGGTLIKQGAGTLTLAGSNSFSGLDVQAGGVTLRNGAALSNTATVTLADVSSAVLTLEADETIGSLAGGGANGGNLALGTAALSTGGNSASTVFSGVISGSAAPASVQLVKQGGGSFTLTGANGYTGATRIVDGVLSIAGDTQLGTAPVLATAGSLQLDGGTLQITGTGSLILATSRGLQIGAGGGTIDVADTVRYAGVATGGTLTKVGAGSLTLAGNNTFGALNLNGGGVVLEGGSALADTAVVTLADTAGVLLTLSTDETLGSLAGGGASGGNVALGTHQLRLGGINTSTGFGGVISGTGAGPHLVKLGSGSFTLTNSNTYTGVTQVLEGTLQLGDGSAGGALAASSTVQLADDAVLRLNRTAAQGVQIVGNSIVNLAGDSTGRVEKVGDGTVVLTGSNAYGGTTTIADGTLQIGNGGGSGTLGTGDVANDGTLAFNRTGSVTVANRITGTGGLRQIGPGTTVLSGDNLYSGSTVIDAGSLTAQGGNAIGDASAVQIANAAGAQLVLGADETIGSLAGGGSVALGTHALTTGGNGGSTLYAGVISGSGSAAAAQLLKVGGGSFTLAGANTFSGGLSIDQGTVLLQGGAALADGVAVTLANATGATLGLLAGEDIGSLAGGGAAGGQVLLGGHRLGLGGDKRSTEFLGVIAGSGEVDKRGSGALTLSGINSFTGTLRVSAGEVLLRGGQALADTLAVVLADAPGAVLTLQADEAIGSLAGGGALGGTVQLGSHTLTTGGNGSSTDFAGVIEGSGGFTKTGAGTQTLSGANAFTGPVRIAGGGLTLQGGQALADMVAVTLDDAAGVALTLAASETIGSLAGGGAAGGSVQLGSQMLTTGGNGSSTVFSGVIAGSGGIAKTGAGTLVLAGANTFTGPLSIQQGSVVLQGGAALADSVAVTLADAAGAALQLDADEAIGSLAGGGSNGGEVQLGSHTLTTGADGSSTVFAGTLSGTGGLVKTGAGSFTLAGANRFTGPLAIAGGELVLQGGAALEDGVAVTLADAAGVTLRLADAETIGSLAGGGAAGGGVQLGANDLTTGGNGASTTFGGTIAGSGGLVKTGAGVLTLAGANSFSGPLRIVAGEVTLQGGQALADGVAVTLADAAGVSLNLGADEAIGSLAGGGSAGGNVQLGSHTLTTGADGSSTAFAGVIAGTGGLTKTGAGTLVLSGANRFTGPVSLQAGGLTLQGGAALADTVRVTLADAPGTTLTLDASETIGSLAGGGASGGLVQLGAQTLTTGGDDSSSSFAGSLAGSGGLVKIGTGTLTLAGANRYTGATSIQAGGLALAGGQALDDASTVQLADAAGATLSLLADETVGALAGGGSSGGRVALAEHTLSTGANGADSRFDGTIDGSGGLVKVGGGRFTLGGANGYTGLTAVRAGTLATAGADRLAAASTLQVFNGAAVELGGDQTLAAIADGAGEAADGSAAIRLAEHRLTVGDAGSSVFSGVLSGAGGLSKVGSGSLTLAGANSYTGATLVEAGTLATRGDERIADTSALQVANGATLRLGGNETVASLADRTGQAADGSATIDLASFGLTTGDTTDTTFTGLLTGDAGSTAVAQFTKQGSGTMTLANPADNRYAGKTAVTGGVLRIGRAGHLGLAPAAASAAADHLRLAGGGSLEATSDLPLGNVTVEAGGDSRIEATGNLVLGGNLLLAADARLALVANAAPGYTPAPLAVGVVDPTGRPIHFASDTIDQQGGVVTTAAGSRLLLLSPAGGSIRLGNVANDFGGTVSALSGTTFGQAWASNAENEANPLLPARQSVITLAGQQVRVGSHSVATGGNTVAVDGLSADLVRIEAGQLSTQPGSRIRARLWYADEAFGTVRSTPGLQLTLVDPLAYTGEGTFGNSDAPIAVEVGAITTDAPRTGLSAGFVQVLPKNGARGSTAIYLTGPSIAGGLYSFFHDGAGLLSEVPVLYNGFLPASPQLSGSLSSVASVSEQARKERFEEAVRTENVAVRLRAGVIAEVGPGRPATQGSDGIRLPEQCDPPWPALDCPK